MHIFALRMKPSVNGWCKIEFLNNFLTLWRLRSSTRNFIYYSITSASATQLAEIIVSDLSIIFIFLKDLVSLLLNISPNIFSSISFITQIFGSNDGKSPPRTSLLQGRSSNKAYQSLQLKIRACSLRMPSRFHINSLDRSWVWRTQTSTFLGISQVKFEIIFRLFEYKVSNEATYSYLLQTFLVMIKKGRTKEFNQPEVRSKVCLKS